MREILISVVLPIYNVEKYLNRCVESIVNQTYSNLEIIMVDDGSKDSCASLCDEWALKDRRIKVIHKENAGLGMARNTGIDNATGDYICFFDSDDYIELDALEILYEEVMEHSPDLLLFGHYDIDRNGNVSNTIVPSTNGTKFFQVNIINEILPDLLRQGNSAAIAKNLWMSAWSCLYSMEMIRKTGWRFISEREIISEDVYSLLELFPLVNSLSIIEKPLYNYCENAASLTHTFRNDRVSKILYFYTCSKKKCEELKYNEDIFKALAYPFIANIIAAQKMILKSDLDAKEKKEKLKDIINDAEVQEGLNLMELEKESFKRKLLLLAMRKKKVLFVNLLLSLNELLK